MLANGFPRLAIRSLHARCQYSPRKTLQRCYSTVFSSLQPDQVQVKVGSNGLINLDIYHPPQSPKTNNPAILYLPRGPVFPTGSSEPASLLSLATAANSTVVRLNYRLSKEHRYPGPVHDVLAGYDWVVANLMQNARSPPYHSGDEQGQIAVCGEFIGGSLAAALSLTECPLDKTGVRALVMGNPISDWSSMHLVPIPKVDIQSALQKTKTGRRKRAPKLPAWEAYAHSSDLSAAALLRARNNLFHIPEDYFDVFASPMLFFRTPIVDVPPDVDALNEIFLPPEIAAVQPAKKRKSHRRYPPSDGGELILPHTKVMVGEKSVLKDQGIELAEGIARSIHSYGGPMGTGEGTGWERVDVEIKPGLGTWNEDDLVEIGSYFREVFRS